MSDYLHIRHVLPEILNFYLLWPEPCESRAWAAVLGSSAGAWPLPFPCFSLKATYPFHPSVPCADVSLGKELVLQFNQCPKLCSEPDLSD